MFETSPAPGDRGLAAAWAPERIERTSTRLEEATLEEGLRWALDSFAPDICLATSFGPQSIVLMHQVSRLRPETVVFYLDTGLLFPETYALRDRLSETLGLRFTRVLPVLTVEEQAERLGPELWSHAPDRCCELRKVRPLRRMLAGKRAWITGVRKGHGASRSKTRLLEWDAANAIVKINPLVGWSSEQVWDYLRAHRLPTNPLHQQGYPSIGCGPCTRAVLPGEDPRAGRWPGFEKTECGIHEPGPSGLVTIDDLTRREGSSG